MTKRFFIAFPVLLVLWLLIAAYVRADYADDLQTAVTTLANDNQIVIVGHGPSIMQNSLNGFIPFLSRPEVNDAIIFYDCTLGSNQQRFEDPTYFGWDWGPCGSLDKNSVDVVMYYNALTGPSGTMEQYVQAAADSYAITYGIIADRYPNAQLVLHSSQHYAGWCGQCKAPEPYAYWQKYAVDELISRWADGEITGPVLAWNAYHWDDTWPASYYAGDGLHLAGPGQQATGQLWHDYLSTSIHAAWYLDGTPQPTATPGGATATPSPFPSSTTTGEATMTPTRGGGCGRACQTATSEAGN